MNEGLTQNSQQRVLHDQKVYCTTAGPGLGRAPKIEDDSQLRRGVHRRIRLDEGGIIRRRVPIVPVGQLQRDKARHGGALPDKVAIGLDDLRARH